VCTVDNSLLEIVVHQVLKPKPTIELFLSVNITNVVHAVLRLETDVDVESYHDE